MAKQAPITAISIAEHVAHDLAGLDTIASADLDHTHTDPDQAVRVDVVTQGGKRFIVGVTTIPEGVVPPEPPAPEPEP